MIVKNEAQTLGRCLKSVQGLVDEAIVVDTGSSDQTAAVARDHGAIVYDRAWTNDFATARNESIALAQGSWILVLDADEVLLPGCVDSLQAMIQTPDLIAVTLLRQEIGAQQTPYSLIARLFRRHPQIRFNRPYHESIDDSAMALIAQSPHWRIGTLTIPAIAHEGYTPEAIESRRKAERAAAIMEPYLAAHPTDAYICSKLGALYVSQGRSEQGLAILQQGLNQQVSDATRYELHFHLGLAYKNIGQSVAARHHYEAALGTTIPDLLKLAALLNLAALCADLGALSEAEALLLKTLQIQPDWAMAYYNLGLVYKAQGEFSGAIAAYRRAIELQPVYPEAHQNLGVVLFKLGQIPEGLAEFQTAIALYEKINPAEALHLQGQLKALGWIP